MIAMTATDWISLGSMIAAAASAVFTGWGLWFTHRQWKKIQSKVAMISDSGRAAEVLPAWYTSRMMDDYWLFGLLTTDGRLFVIRKITAISDDGKWMDVELASADEVPQVASRYGSPVHAVAPNRTDASVQISSIVAAVDLQSS